MKVIVFAVAGLIALVGCSSNKESSSSPSGALGTLPAGGQATAHFAVGGLGAGGPEFGPAVNLSVNQVDGGVKAIRVQMNLASSFPELNPGLINPKFLGPTGKDIDLQIPIITDQQKLTLVQDNKEEVTFVDFSMTPGPTADEKIVIKDKRPIGADGGSCYEMDVEASSHSPTIELIDLTINSCAFDVAVQLKVRDAFVDKLQKDPALSPLTESLTTLQERGNVVSAHFVAP